MPGASNPSTDAPATRLPGRGRLALIGLLLLANAVCLGIGLTGDAVTVGTTVRKSLGPLSMRMLDERETFSILASLGKLWEEGSRLLAAVIFLFSVLFPIAKWLANALVWARFLRAAPASAWMHATAARLHWLGRWSMLDVFVVGILCVWGKLGGHPLPGRASHVLVLRRCADQHGQRAVDGKMWPTTIRTVQWMRT